MCLYVILFLFTQNYMKRNVFLEKLFWSKYKINCRVLFWGERSDSPFWTFNWEHSRSDGNGLYLGGWDNCMSLDACENSQKCTPKRVYWIWPTLSRNQLGMKGNCRCTFYKPSCRQWASKEAYLVTQRDDTWHRIYEKWLPTYFSNTFARLMLLTAPK